MNYDMNMIKYRKSGFFRIAAAILIICFRKLQVQVGHLHGRT